MVKIKNKYGNRNVSKENVFFVFESEYRNPKKDAVNKINSVVIAKGPKLCTLNIKQKLVKKTEKNRAIWR